MVIVTEIGGKMIKKKIIGFVVDFILFVLSYTVAELITKNIFNTDKFLPMLLTFVVIYGVISIVKELIGKVISNFKGKEKNEQELEDFM